MRVLFRCNVGGERATLSKDHSQGIGHLSRCLPLRELFERNGDETHFLVEGDTDVAGILRRVDLSFSLNQPEPDVLRRFRPDLTFLDINYYDPSRLCAFREFGPVVNLAPRGEVKYHADATFNDLSAVDVSAAAVTARNWFRGPQYALLGLKYAAVREKRTRKPTFHQILVSMGGVDQFNLTEFVLRELQELLGGSLRVLVVLGPLYPYSETVRAVFGRDPRFVFELAPPDLAELMLESDFGIFATGVTTYEGLCLGLPSINLGLTEFHDLRGAELENFGVVLYCNHHLTPEMRRERFRATVTSLAHNREKAWEMSEKASKLVDGQGAQRVFDRTVALFGARA